MRAWAVVFVVVALFSCTRTVYVPVTEHRNVYTTVRDTVIVLAERGDKHARVPRVRRVWWKVCYTIAWLCMSGAIVYGCRCMSGL